MSRLPRRVLVIIVAAMVALIVGAPPTNVRAATAPDKSDVVLVLDFSASILEEPADRNRFGAALERIADRVEESASELVAGDTTITVIQFATKAAVYEGCADLRLLNSPPSVARFARCLRLVGNAYRKGLQPALTRRVGVDTNYVAALEQAAKHLPAEAVRPTLIMFTDGRHDVRGVPGSQVRVVRDRLFGSRSPFALLPVGMGLDPAQRNALESGLVGLRIVRDMPPCVSGETFDWPAVVFDSPDKAGNAVAVALQNATCTFTVEPVPTPAPLPGIVQGIRLTAADRAIELVWGPPASTSVPIVGYRARCRAGDGDWIEAKEGVSLNTTATVDGLSNGVAYTCEVAAMGEASAGTWTAATTAVTPMARPVPTPTPTAAPEVVITCGSLIECNPLLVPVLAVVIGLGLAGGLLALFLPLFQGRRRGYVVAVVDGIYSANLGHGSRLGIEFVRDPSTKRLTGIVPDRGSKPDIRVRRLRGDRFEVIDRAGRHVASSGETVLVAAGAGRHALVLQGFATNPAAAVTSRR